MTDSPEAQSRRAVLREQLHQRYQPHQYDNWVVWAGNHEVTIDGTRCSATLARAYVGPGHPRALARVRVELFVAAVDPAQVRAGEVEARLWTDADRRGSLDGEGIFRDDPGRYLPMHLVGDQDGVPVRAGNNLVFESDEFPLTATGAYAYTVELSADLDQPPAARRWVSINEMADNRNGVIVVSPEWIQRQPAVAEVCSRKVGARMVDGRFQSGRLRQVTAFLPRLPAEVVYLLPFFKPGFGDLHRHEDVRKGELGSVYAVQDFFAVDPALVSPPEEADLPRLVREGLILDQDLAGTGLARTAELAALSPAEAVRRLGLEPLQQVIGRAELRELTRQAHALGKRVIFDLVLMQTSRDNPLIESHPEYYLLDEHGVPRIHQIAWLIYSDVALFDLVFNWPLQNYLLKIAPYWIETCGLDGVRIDASQTVDRPFLRRIKNRINAVHPEALVLGETLCPLDQALDVPVDMVYALLVDFHRDVQQATPLIDFLEEMHRRYAPGTVAMAYFENHDSPRATQVWRDRYAGLLGADDQAARQWRRAGDQAPLRMALLKNLQASLIDLSAGLTSGASLTCGLELGSWWGETTRTDFENPTLLDLDAVGRSPHRELDRAYGRLLSLATTWPEVRDGRVYYHRHGFPGGDPEDQVLAYVRHCEDGALLFLHGFDAVHPRQVILSFDYLPWPVDHVEFLFDTFPELGLQPSPPGPGAGPAPGFPFLVQPLQSRVIRLHPRA
ncbi:MAG: alpha-amylase family glycosyl hydrolase [Candidatus Latescibacterota bacterium]|jgi:hypothetical protein